MRLFPVLPAALLGLAALSCTAAEPAPVGVSLVKDLNTTRGVQSSAPSLFVAAAGRVYFSATAPGVGQELHSTDAQGNLRLLADIAPGPQWSLPEPLAVIGDRLIATANDGLTGRQLWSVPVQGGQPVRLTSMGFNWYNPPGTAQVAASFNGRVMMHVSTQGYGLWSTDGTPGGTYYRGSETGFPLGTVLAGCNLQDAAILAGHGASPQAQLVRSNGVPGGDSILASLPSGASPRFAVASAGVCYFLVGSSTPGWFLWRSDGTPQGTLQLASGAGHSPGSMVAHGNDVYFLDYSDSSFGATPVRTRLWRLAAGTAQPQMVVELPGPTTPSGSLWSHEGLVLFNAFAQNGSSFESALFASDGTAAGTRRLHPPPGQYSSGYVYPVAGGVVLSPPSYTSGSDLRIDLPGGTVTTVDSDPFNYQYSVLLDGVRIGLGEPYGGDQEVWITTGAQGSTRMLNDVWPQTADGLGQVGVATAIGDTLYFTHGYVREPNGDWSSVLWRSDGSEAGTRMLPRDQYQDRQVSNVLRYGDSGVLFLTSYWYPGLYFADAALSTATRVAPGVYGNFLQSTDNGLGAIHPCGGGSGGLCGIHPGSGGSVLGEGGFGNAKPIGELGGVAVFFSAASYPGDVWRSDGTPAGTYRLLAGRELMNDERKLDLVLDGKMYFITCTASYACDLTVTDGTVAGTRLLLPVPVASMAWAGRAGGRLVLSIRSGSAGEVWSTDGTVAGTQLLRSGNGTQFASTGDRVHMKFDCTNNCKQSHLVTDGTPAGTRLVDLPSSLSNSGRFAAALGANAVVFSCQNQQRGNELCLSNANGDEIVALPEIFPGGYPSDPLLIGRTDSAVYFSADDAEHGRELWQLRLLADAVFADGFQ